MTIKRSLTASKYFVIDPRDFIFAGIFVHIPKALVHSFKTFEHFGLNLHATKFAGAVFRTSGFLCSHLGAT